MVLTSRRGLVRLLAGAQVGGADEPRDHVAEARRVVVCVFLRGGADGLSLIPPHAEPRYHALRPTLALARPDDARAAKAARAIDLDGRFGLHPGLAPLLPAWGAGELAVVHAVGSDDETRSHFEAMDRMEHAGAAGRPASDGWLARHLAIRRGARASPLAAVALAPAVPESLRGTAAAAVESIASYRLGGGDRDPSFEAALAELYREPAPGRDASHDDLAAAGRETLAVLRRFETLGGAAPTKGADGYPEHAFGAALREIAALVRAHCGLEVATVDLGGWDTHFVQNASLPGTIDVLGRGLAALRADLGDAFENVEVVVMTEFGRRVRENTSLGTDHGRGSVMLLLGGGVAGGRVVTDWPGLDEGRLVGPGDLAVTIDYRDVLAELCVRRLGSPRPSVVFPGFEPTMRGLFR